MMTPEDIAAILKNTPLKQLLEALSILDPDMVKIMEVVNMLRNQGYGEVRVTIHQGQVTDIDTTFKNKVR